ncbi:pilin [Aquella oligotrophica]|uniref:Prepilin-type N-terminal cleavage/methylation domain-containing protein n=1 Tax=Aquella oligotrophica TaxID=2067065 RepID=A0A2I7N8J8_9NEIS|nr:prepilin-type N-terminal cleavage/methylation domain-containing protein [Aquella oligotrophica]AUR52778.1 hypothetical protein CUN60_10905 [Aquella oligotrophica]
MLKHIKNNPNHHSTIISSPKTKGFSIIELMIAVAILGILAAIAIPAYDIYVKRAQISEGYHFARMAALSVAEYYQTNGVYPATLAQAGINASNTGNYVTGVSIASNGVITVSLLYGSNQTGSIVFTPSSN